MKRTGVIAVLAVFVAFLIYAAEASAMYNPRLGRFMQRDPGPGAPMRVGEAGPAGRGSFLSRDQYADGMNLYQYTQGSPLIGRDPQGLKNTSWSPSGTIKDGVYEWRYSFNVTFHHEQCRVGFRVKIQLNGADSKVDSELRRLVFSWSRAVKEAFKGWKLVPERPGGHWGKCKDGASLTFRAKFIIGSTSFEDQDVDVDSENARNDMLNWHLGHPRISSAPYQSVVHEVAHMFGLKDEYPDPDAPKRTIAPEGAGSIMHTSRSGKMLKRHIEDIVINIAKVNYHLPCPKYKVEPK